MFQFRHDLIKYFDERFSFFGFSLPLLALIFPIIPNMIPLYSLPRFYGLIVTYLFLIIFNLRLYRDLMEKRVTKKSFYYLYLAETIVLFSFTFLFHFAEVGRPFSITDSVYIIKWRSFFFFLSSLSLVSLCWLWYSVIRPLVKRSYFTELAPMIKYPLFLIPPLLFKIHESQLETLLYYAAVILAHALSFELLSNDFLKKMPSYKKVGQLLLTVYLLLIGPGFYLYHEEVFISLFLTLIGLGFLYKGSKLDPRALFVSTILFNWLALFSY